MAKANPILQHDPAEFYSGDALDAARAIRNHDYTMLKTILARSRGVASSRGEKDLPLLAWAMGHRDPQAFKMLLQAGAPADDFIRVEGVKMSLLSVATGAEQPDYFNLLLAFKANPNGLPDTEPPLLTAVRRERPERIDPLLKHGADPNRPDGAGATLVLELALGNDYVRARDFIRKGADPKAAMKNGTDLRRIIDHYPLPPDTQQGQAQGEIKRLLK